MKTHRGKVGEQIATKAQVKVDVAIKYNKEKKIAKARAPANAKAQRHTRQAIASSTLRQTQKEAHMRHSSSSLRRHQCGMD
jgi:3-hydroxyacyl-CoA dehydrogenase